MADGDLPVVMSQDHRQDDDFADPRQFARETARFVAIRTLAFGVQYTTYHRLGWSKLRSVVAGLAVAVTLGVGLAARRRWADDLDDAEGGG